MNVKVIATGSKGNCIWVQSEGVGVLIDAGLPKTHIEKRLSENGISPVDINAIFISHAHGDHISGLTLANKYKINVYASEGEWKRIKNVDDDLQRTIRYVDGKYEFISIGDIMIYPFKIHHDAAEPLGYAIEDNEGNRCCVVFDTGHVDQEMLEYMEGNIYVVEANHEPSMVEECNRPDSVKARILSDIGHLSNEQCAAALKELIRGKGERIYLTHLSGDNNTKQLAENTVKLALWEKGFVKGKHYQLEVIR